MGNSDFKIRVRVFLIFDPLCAETAYRANINARTEENVMVPDEFFETCFECLIINISAFKESAFICTMEPNQGAGVSRSVRQVPAASRKNFAYLHPLGLHFVREVGIHAFLTTSFGSWRTVDAALVPLE